MSIRLDKYLADLGVGTRSEVKKRVRAGQITVNGVCAGRPEMKIDETADEVCVNGEKLTYARFAYYLLHKPAGCVSAVSDRVHRTVLDYLPDTVRAGLFPVGRLDLDTEGLLLLTDDGALAHALLSPAKHVKKTYYVKVAGKVADEEVCLFRSGIDIGDDKPTLPAELVILSAGEVSEAELTISEGRYHQVKRMFAAVGKEVVYLRRIAMGPLLLPKDLKPGEYRPLTKEERAALGR